MLYPHGCMRGVRACKRELVYTRARMTHVREQVKRDVFLCRYNTGQCSAYRTLDMQ